MAMSAADFFVHFKKLNRYLEENPDASDELKARTKEMSSAFRGAYSADEFREAIANKAPVDTELEEKTTSALMALNQDRAIRRS